MSHHEYIVKAVETLSDGSKELVLLNPWGPAGSAPYEVPLAEIKFKAWINSVSSLPDRPEVATVGGSRVALYPQGVQDSAGSVTATRGVGTAATSGGPPTAGSLEKGETRIVDGFAITLLDAFDPEDPERDVADVTVTRPDK